MTGGIKEVTAFKEDLLEEEVNRDAQIVATSASWVKLVLQTDNLITGVKFLESTWWKERTAFCKWSFDLNIIVRLLTQTHTQ